MSLFDNDRYTWRETYFVLFDRSERPNADKLQQILLNLNPRFQIGNVSADEEGQIVSLTVSAPDDYAALDISYLAGDEVEEQVVQLATEVEDSLGDESDREKMIQMTMANARFDVMHFEQTTGDEGDEMLDPSALLAVLDALTDLTGGICVDPQSGTLM